MSEYRIKPDGSDDVVLTATETGTLADGRKVGAANVAGGTSTLTTMQNAAGATGNGTALGVTGHGAAAIQITGTFVATVTFEGTANGTDYVSLPAQNVATGAVATTATAEGIYVVPTMGLSDVRARVSAYTSGNVTAKGRAIGLALPSPYVTVSGRSGPNEWTATATSAANAAATATKAAEANKKHIITGYLVVLRAAAAGNDTSAILKDGATAKITDYIGNAAPRGTRIGMTGLHIELSTNTAANLEAAAAGAGAITELTLVGYTIDA